MNNIRFIVLVLLGLPLVLAGQKNIAIWDFKNRDGSESQTSKNLTIEFEEALIQSKEYNILERRNSDRLLAIIQAEKSIGKILDISDDNIDELKALSLDMVVFGEVFDDVNSGEISIRVTFEELNGNKVKVKSVLMRRGLIFDQRSRRSKMEELVRTITDRKKENNYTKKVEKKMQEALGYGDIDPEDFKEEYLDVKVRTSSGVNPGVSIYVKRPVKGYEVYYSVDNQSYEEYIPNRSPRIKDYRKDQLFIKLVSEDNQKEIGPFHKKGLFSSVYKEQLARAVKTSGGGPIDCFPTGCEVNHRSLCSSMAAEMTLGREKGKPEIKYDLSQQNCEVAEAKNSFSADCLAVPNEIFPLNPGDKVYGSINYADGFKVTFEETVKQQLDINSGSNQDHGWVALKPFKDNMDIPYASATYVTSKHSGPVKVFLGAGGCRSRIFSQDITSFLYDIDGNGLVEASKYGTIRIKFSIPVPEESWVEMAYDLNSGERIGPFKYKIDIEKLIDAFAKGVDPPRLNFSYYRDQFFGKVDGRFHLLSWWYVSEIKLGPSPDQLTESIPIDLKVEDILNSRNKKNIEYYRFDIPKDWTDVYYTITFEDGKVTHPIRYIVKKF